MYDPNAKIEVTYTVRATADVDPEMLRDLATKAWVVIRKSSISTKAWSFHATEALAKAAARRHRSRDIVTR